jgi:hypothetical protein
MIIGTLTTQLVYEEPHNILEQFEVSPVSPADGSAWYDVNSDKMYYWNDLQWEDSEAEVTRDIEVVTLSQYCYEQAAEEAWQYTSDHFEVDQMAQELAQTKYTHQNEFITFNDNKIVIGVDRVAVDDAAIDYAMEMLSKVDYLKEFNTIEFRQ